MRTPVAKRNLLWMLGGAVTAGAAYLLFARPKHLRWGATRTEAGEYLPGDELILDADSSATHAITIKAAPEDVWPWIAQIGQDKGGFYSYTLLENAVGCDMHNASEINPEWQELEVGDEIVFHPEFPPAPVVLLEKEHHLVIGANLLDPNASSWAFVLRDLGNGSTRFIVRLRGRAHHGLGHLADLAVLEPAHFVMERKMMLTIKELAEQRAKAA